MESYGQASPTEISQILGSYLSTYAHESLGYTQTQPADPTPGCVTIVMPLVNGMSVGGFQGEDVRIGGLRFIAKLFNSMLVRAEAADPSRNMSPAVSPQVNPALMHDHDLARAIHRVVRAMHDGECPKCHNIHRAELMWRKADMVCPTCSFTITGEQATAGLAEFGKFMEKNLALFEAWRAEREPHADTK